MSRDGVSADEGGAEEDGRAGERGIAGVARLLLLVTDLELGGTPRVVRELAVRLNRIRPGAVQVACLGGWGPVADEIHQAGVQVTALGARGPADWRVLPRLRRLLQGEGIDTLFSFLVHANTVAAAACALNWRIRCIQSIQTTQRRPRWHWWVQRIAQERGEKIVVPSASVALAAERWAGAPRGKIIVISNAVDVEAFSGVRQVEEDARPFPIGFIGRLDPIKRVPDLLEAVARLKGLVHLHVFGEGPERGRIEAEIARLGIGDGVTLHGAVGRPQEALGRIGVLVLPSEAEGFGLVLIEAMAAGVAVVATNAPGIRDVVRDGQTGLLVPAGDPALLARGIGRIVRDGALRRALVERGRLEVRERFSWEPVMEAYRRLLRM